MPKAPALAVWVAVVVAAMVVLFRVPPGYFVLTTFVSTGLMVAGAYFVSKRALKWELSYPRILLGVASAAVLYLVFYAVGGVIALYHPFGMTQAAEGSIYSLISSPGNPLPLQVLVLLFDATGYETFFRGTLQKRLQPRAGVFAAPVVALFDAALHLVSLNLLWVGATFVADLAWGLTYHYGKGTQASFTSHFLWDLAIFIVRPVL